MFLIGSEVRGQSNLVLLVSQPGDFIGDGATHVTTDINQFGLVWDIWGLDTTAFGYNIWIDGGPLPLEVGDYPNATRDPFNFGTPGLSVFGNGRGCNTVCGNFHIYELDTNNAGQVLHLWLTFTQYCECLSAPLVGEIRYHSLLAPAPPPPRILHVPAEYPTIQSAIDDASWLTVDTVLATNGTYYESLDFKGKPVAVTSVNGPQVTFIRGTGPRAVNFANGENTNSCLAGFTVDLVGSGWAIAIFGASPKIVSNVITHAGYGVICETGSPVIENNTFYGTSTGITIASANSVLIQSNVISENESGISLVDNDSATVRYNRIQDNTGDGIYSDSDGGLAVVQNIIGRNGGWGLNIFGAGAPGTFLFANTIERNNSGGIHVDHFFSNLKIGNNIVDGNPALLSGYNAGDGTVMLEFNDFYSVGNSVFISGMATNLAGINGNISADPEFACPPSGDYHLAAGSPCVDSGTNDFSLLPDSDFDGNPRVLAGNSNGPAIADMGAFEFNPLDPPNPCLYIDCQTDIVVAISAFQNSTIVNFPTPRAGVGATITCVPPSGSVFNAGTNTVTCTATLGSNSVNCNFQVIVKVAPTIFQQPQDVQVRAGQSFTLSVGVAGPPVGYEWEFYGDPLDGQSNSNLVIGDAQAANDGSYNVFISSDAGITNSRMVRVHVLPSAPTFVVQPQSGTILAGFDTILYAGASGSEPLSYIWYFNSRKIPGATGPELILSDVQAANAGSYHAVAINTNGVAKSKTVSLRVQATLPIFEVNPESSALRVGDSITLWTGTRGSEPTRYQWYHNGRIMQGQVNAYLRLDNVTPAASGSYYCAARNFRGKSVSDTAIIDVQTPPQITQMPSNQVARIGQTVALQVKAAGDQPITYTWTLNGAELNCTNPVLVISNIQTAQAGYYHITARNKSDYDTAFAKISVLGPPGRLVAWGDNRKGQTNAPAGLTNVVAVTGGDFHSLALVEDGTLSAWGDNSEGQTAIISNLPPFVSIAAGASHNLAIAIDGSIWAWGRNDHHQCEIPYYYYSYNFNIYPFLPVAISAGDNHSLALLDNGVVAAWGDNSYGQSSVPYVLEPDRSWWDPNPDFIPAMAIAAGRNHSLVVLTNGSVLAWGDYTGGQCDVPPALTNATAVAGGFLHSVALRADHTVVAWGDNTYGQTNVPPDLTNVVAIAAGDYDTLALLADGSVIAWGDNQYGQSTVPGSVTNAIVIGSGYYHSFAVLPVKH